MQVRILAPIRMYKLSTTSLAEDWGACQEPGMDCKSPMRRPIWRKLGPGAIQETEDRIGSAECSP